MTETWEAGTSFLWVSLLYPREGTREHFLDSLPRDWLQLLPRDLHRELGEWPPRPIIEPSPREPEPEPLTLPAS